MEGRIYDNVSDKNMYITAVGRSLLVIISRWARFLAILGFIFLGIGVIFILFSGTMISGMNRYMAMEGATYYVPGAFSWLYATAYLIMLLIYFFPFYFLYKFATRTRKALLSDDPSILTEALNALKNHYVYIGILTIIGIVFMVISCILMVSGYAGSW